jgi:hypothetical protein
LLVDLSIARRRIIAGAAGLVVVAASLAVLITTGDDSTTVIASKGDPAAMVDVDSASTTTTATSTTATSTTATSTATLVEPKPPQTVIQTTTFDPAGLEAELVADLPNGVQLVRYAEPTDTDCAAGTLVAEASGALLTVYDMPFAGGIRALPSSYGPTALIGSCEEWINWVAFYDDPRDMESAPSISAHELPDDIFFLWDFSWIGLTGYLGATASFSDGASQATTLAIAIDADDGSVEVADDVFGERSVRSPDGFDLLVPEGWESIDSVGPSLEIRLPESGTRLRVDASPAGGDVAQPDEDEIVDDTRDIELTVWEDDDGVRPATWAAGVETRFVSTESTRYVREIELADRVVTAALEVPAAAGRGEVLFALYLLDQVRIYDTVG